MKIFFNLICLCVLWNLAGCAFVAGLKEQKKITPAPPAVQTQPQDNHPTTPILNQKSNPTTNAGKTLAPITGR